MKSLKLTFFLFFFLFVLSLRPKCQNQFKYDSFPLKIYNKAVGIDGR